MRLPEMFAKSHATELAPKGVESRPQVDRGCWPPRPVPICDPPLLSRVNFAEAHGKLDPKFRRPPSLWQSLGGDYAVSTLARSHSFLPSMTPPRRPREAEVPGQGLSKAGSVHVHVIYADDRRAGGQSSGDLMQGSGSTPVGDNLHERCGKADFRHVTVGEYHVVVSGEGIETTYSDIFEVDARQVTQSAVRYGPSGGGRQTKAGPRKPGTVSASDLKVPENARKELDKANVAMAQHDWKKAVELA